MRPGFSPTNLMMGCLFQIFFGLVTLGLSVLIPALFTATVWLTGAVLMLLSQATERSLTEGAIILLPTATWATIFALLSFLFLPITVWFGIAPGAILVGGAAAGTCWGLCVGYRLITVQRQTLLRMPDPDPPHVFGQPGGFYQRHGAQTEREWTVEELFEEGIVLGERVGRERRR